jgi:RP/EB family microtubule-associated protein
MNKHIEVERLVKAKYQDNLEFLQWIKRFHEINGGGMDYNADERRKGVDVILTGGGQKASTTGSGCGGGAEASSQPKFKIPT